MAESEGCGVIEACERFGADLAILRAKDDDDLVLAVHLYASGETAQELDLVLTAWEKKGEEDEQANTPTS